MQYSYSPGIPPESLITSSLSFGDVTKAWSRAACDTATQLWLE